jgi:cytochrome c-type biogenesis protein CcmH/NrfF
VRTEQEMIRCVLWVALCAVAAAETPKERVARLQNSLLAPCCFAEPVGRHQSEAAVKMRLEIARLAVEGKRDEEIVDRYVGQYGARILVDPKSRPAPWSLVAPWAVVAVGALGVSALIWKWRRPRLQAPAGSPPAPGVVDEDWLDD